MWSPAARPPHNHSCMGNDKPAARKPHRSSKKHRNTSPKEAGNPGRLLATPPTMGHQRVIVKPKVSKPANSNSSKRTPQQPGGVAAALARCSNSGNARAVLKTAKLSQQQRPWQWEGQALSQRASASSPDSGIEHNRTEQQKKPWMVQATVPKQMSKCGHAHEHPSKRAALAVIGNSIQQRLCPAQTRTWCRITAGTHPN